MLLDKSNLKNLEMKDVSIELPDLKNIFESKSVAIANWICQWIERDLIAGKIQEANLLPAKADFAYALGVSIGTMQNAFRYVEDKGYVESKQCIGTMVRDWRNPTTSIRKLTSKREVAIELIKKYIIDSKIKVGQKLPSSRNLAKIIENTPNTTRLALEQLCSSGIIEHKHNAVNDSNWVIISKDFEIIESKLSISSNITLVEKIEQEIENYIEKNFSIGTKMPSHDELSREFKVSIKTIHDALKGLIKKGILLARRGRYGTTVIKMPNNNNVDLRKEASIFAPAKEAVFYNYEKTQNHIKQMLAKDYEIGEKLPSIIELSKQLDLSPNTIRKAFANLSDEGYLRFQRGRYGGTFVVDIPDMSAQSFKWLAVNPKYVAAYK